MPTKKYICAGCEKEITGSYALKIIGTTDYLCARSLDCRIGYLIRQNKALHMKKVQIR